MRVAVIHSRLDRRGGTQRKVLSCALALKKLGHEVTVYTLAYDKNKCYPEILKDLRVTALSGYSPSAQKSRIPFLGPLNYFIYSRNENEAARALVFLIEAGTEVLHPYDRLGYRVACFYKKLVLDIPSVAVMDDVYLKIWSYWRKKQFDPTLFMPIKRRVFYWMLDRYESARYILPHEEIVVLDNRTQGWVRKYFDKQARIVRNGIDGRQFPYVERNPPRNRRVTLLSTGIFFLHRRYEDIIKAVRILCDQGYDASLVITGNFRGPEYYSYYARLKELSENLGLGERIEFVGSVSEEVLRRHYAGRHIYVSANHLQSWGLAVFEAMSSGMPVVVSDTTGAAEVLRDHETAMLVPPASPKAIARAVRELCVKPEFYREISVRGKKFVEKNISWERTASELVSILSEVLKRRAV